jgi:hypothetical protein
VDSVVLQEGLLPLTSAPRWDKIFLFLVGSLASTILLKIGPIQYLEIICILQIALLLLNFLRVGLRTTWFRPFLSIGVGYALFGLTSIILAFASLRFTFYLPAERSGFSEPVLITISRNVELAAVVIIMLSIADIFRKEPNKLRFTMRVYFWTGVASAIYSYLSYPLDVLNIVSLGSYNMDHRLRGFYNEGGPYGLYLITIFCVGFALREQNWERRRRINVGLACIPLAFFMAGSKSGFSALLVLMLLNGLLARSLAKRIHILCANAIGMVAVLETVDIALAFRTYQKSSAAYERASHLHSQDPNFVYGRVAGLFIVPRMIAAHPFTGVGWGNYGILRNTPEYRGASSWADIADTPSLGLLGYAAELGIPLLLFLIAITILPVIYLRRLGAPAYVLNLALMQPLVELFGAQLNLTYPWVVTSFALGLAYAIQRKQKLHSSAPQFQLPSTHSTSFLKEANG